MKNAITFLNKCDIKHASADLSTTQVLRAFNDQQRTRAAVNITTSEGLVYNFGFGTKVFLNQAHIKTFYDVPQRSHCIALTGGGHVVVPKWLIVDAFKEIKETYPDIPNDRSIWPLINSLTPQMYAMADADDYMSRSWDAFVAGKQLIPRVTLRGSIDSTIFMSEQQWDVLSRN